MHIERITIHNLTAIEGKQVIDFNEEPLRSAGLFAITGATGTGKSTILDAICLALYNKAPRFEGTERVAVDTTATADAAQLPQVQAGNVANLLRRGCREGGAAVVFANERGERYEATWSIRVSAAGKFASPKRSLEMLTPRRETYDRSDINDTIEKAVGLNYDQFTRTVILAQNSFANFLRAKQADKAILLEKLTGTEVYGAISSEIYRSMLQAEADTRDIESEIRGILHDRLEPDELKALEEKLTLLTSQRTTDQEREDLLRKQQQWVESYTEALDNVANHERRFAAATKACMAQQADRQKLDRYDSVLPMQNLYHEMIMRKADTDNIKQQEQEAGLQLRQANAQLHKLQAQLEVLRERTTEAEQHQQQRQAIIDRGHILTGEITTSEKQLRRYEQQLTATGKNLLDRQAALRSREEQLSDVLKKKETLGLHKQSLSVHRLMFEKFDLIKDKLAMLLTESTRNSDSHLKQVALQQRRTDLKRRIEQNEKQRHDYEAKLSTLKSELLIHRQSNSGQNSENLQQRAANSQNKLDALKRAAVLWQHISEGYAAIAAIRADLQRNEGELTRKRNDEQRMQAVFEVTHEAYERARTAYTFSSSDNIVRLRQSLKEGTPCPVCGGTHHPYHTETEQHLGELISNLSKDYEKVSRQLEKQRTDLATLREDIAADVARIQSGKAELQRITARQEADVEEWKTCANLDPSLADCSPMVSSDTRRTTIELLIAGITREAALARQELETYNFHQGHINRLNEAIADLDDVMDRNHQALSKLRTEDQIAEAALTELASIISVSDRSCSQLYTDLDEMVTLSGWYTLWRNNADTLRLRLTALHDDWNRTCSTLDEAERSETLLREEIKNATQSLAEAQQHLADCREARNAAQDELKRKQEELTRLFGTTTPKEEAEQLQQAVRSARLAQQEAQQEAEAEGRSIHQIMGVIDNLAASRTDAQQRLRDCRQQLDLLVLRYNAEHAPISMTELTELFTDTRDWKALRLKLSGLEEQRLLTENRLDQARQQLLALRANPDRPFDAGLTKADDDFVRQCSDLQQQLTDTTARLQALDEQLAALRTKLTLHHTCTKRAEGLQARLDEASRNAAEWRRLNELYGSADGKRFRTMAQSYTFSTLVAHANRHLSTLSPRYALYNRPGTLTLEVIDHYLFDTHRYVPSLSGGETFVVSLALALGLATLSSGTFHIGALFIDEGFGNLDNESLDLVMATLSALETMQGRKVGVISHTEQIRRQISPRIHLRRKLGGTGSSLIEIR